MLFTNSWSYLKLLNTSKGLFWENVFMQCPVSDIWRHLVTSYSNFSVILLLNCRFKPLILVCTEGDHTYHINTCAKRTEKWARRRNLTSIKRTKQIFEAKSNKKLFSFTKHNTFNIKCDIEKIIINQRRLDRIFRYLKTSKYFLMLTSIYFDHVILLVDLYQGLSI